MKIFFSNEDGFVHKKIMVLAAIMILAAYFFPTPKEYARCATNVTEKRFALLLDEKNPEYKEKCDVTESDVPDSPTSPPGGGSDNIGIAPPVGYVPISYYDSSDVSLICNSSQSYYSFYIPSDAHPQSTGTKTLSISNNRGWDMWIKITSVVPINGLKITSYEELYKSLPNGGKTSFNIAWLWDVTSSYSGSKGAATVYFQTTCDEPAKEDTYLPVPPPPSNFQLSNKTETTLSLKWDETEYADSYKLYRNDILVFTGTALNYVDEGLTPGVIYEYDLKAINEKGSSAPATLSAQTDGISPLPNKPVPFEATAITDTTTTLSWNASEKADSYTLMLQNEVIWTGNATSYKISGLTSGTEYTHKVRANNSHGSSEWSVLMATTSGDNPKPGTPTNLRVTNRTDSTLTLSWDEDPKATSYRINSNYGDVKVGDVSTYTFTNLLSGTYYYFYLYPINEHGEGSLASTYGVTTGEKVVPYVPDNFIITNIKNTSMTVSWDEVPNATSYTLVRNWQVVYRGSSTSFQSENLTQNTFYRYDLRANNEVGSSNWTTQSATTTNKTYDDSDDLSNNCQEVSSTKSFSLPSDMIAGSSGLFEIQITNTSSQETTVSIIKVDKNGTYFEGNYPVSLSYDAKDRTVSAKSTIQIPIEWSLSSSAGNEYKDASGTVQVLLKTQCSV